LDEFLSMTAAAWMGIYGAMILAALGSIIGCARAGQAACGAMLDTEGRYGRYLGIAAMPSSQTIYGVVVMLALNRPITEANAPALFAIGILSGVAQMISAIYQGNCCVAAINAGKNKPEIFGLSLAPAALVEGFAVFALAFALLFSAEIP
jgi:V/A-type H+-transporting ATPase subunit K